MLTKSSRLSEDHRQRIKHTLEKAKKYQNRKVSKHKAEMALIRRALPLLGDVRTILDAPCGVGRATIMLAQSGYAVTGVDLGDGALDLARKSVRDAKVAATIEKRDLVRLGYADRQFEAVLCFRLIHHLPSLQHREEIITELCRVAEKYVLLSYLSPWSFTSAKRTLKEKLGIRKSVQHATALTDIQKLFQSHGFALLKDFAQGQFVRSLHLAVFRREGSRLEPAS